MMTRGKYLELYHSEWIKRVYTSAADTEKIFKNDLNPNSKSGQKVTKVWKNVQDNDESNTESFKRT